MRNRDEWEQRVTCNGGALRAGVVATCSWGGGGWEPRWRCCSGRRWLLQGAATSSSCCLLLPMPLFCVYPILRRLFSSGGDAVGGGGATMALVLPLPFSFIFPLFFALSLPVSLFRFPPFFFLLISPLCLSLFLLLFSFLTVQVLLSMIGRTVAAGGGSGGYGRRPRWREKQREEQLWEPGKDDFFLTLDLRSSLPRT